MRIETEAAGRWRCTMGIVAQPYLKRKFQPRAIWNARSIGAPLPLPPRPPFFEAPPRPRRPGMDPRDRRAVGILVRADRDRPAGGSAVRAGRPAVPVRRRSARALRQAPADARALRDRVRPRDRVLPVRPAISRHEARHAGRTLVTRHPGAGVLHHRTRNRARSAIACGARTRSARASPRSASSCSRSTRSGKAPTRR